MCVVHLGGYLGSGRLGVASAKAVAGLRGGGTTASTVPASESVHGPLKLAHEDREGTWVLTEGAGRMGRPCSVDGVMEGGGARRSSRRW